MALFCPEHSNCEAPISVITNILTETDPSKFEEISNEFRLLGFDNIKDLANSSFGKVDKINCLGEDPLAKLYKAIEIYDQNCAHQLKSAKLEYKLKNYDKTLEICQEMLSHKPYDIDFLLLICGTYFSRKEYDNCKKYLLKAYDKHPNCAEIFNNLGLCCCASFDYDTAYQWFRSALLKDVSNSSAWLNCAEMLVLANKTQQAEITYKMILSINPDSYIAHNAYARLLVSLNRIKEAENQYKIALQKAPEHVNIWNNLGNLYKNSDEIEEAINCYKKALELNPNLLKTWSFLGMAYLKLQEFQNAIESFQKALELSPEDISVLKNLGLIYFFQQNWSLVADTFQKVLELRPNDLDSNLQLGLLYYNHKNNYVKAEKYFKKVLELNPQEEIFYKYLTGVNQKLGKHKCASEIAISLGDMLYDRDDYQNAKDAYTWALYLDPENGIGHWKLGNTHYSLGHIDLAFARYKYCLELKPNFANAYSDCGLIFEEKGFLEKALVYYDAAQVLDPKNVIILQNLASLKEKLNNYDDAIKLYHKILKHEDSDDFKVHLDLAKCHQQIGNLNEAFNHCELARSLMMTDEEVIDVSLFFGSILLDLRKDEEALTFFNKTIELNSQCVEGHTYIGSIHKDNGNFIEAIHSYNIALNIIPNFPDAYCNLVQCLQHICDWSDYDNRILKLKEIVSNQLDNDQVPSILPHHSLLYNFSPEILKQIASKYAKQFIDKANVVRKISQDNENQTILSNGRIRVGYVSSNFGDHPTSQLMQSIIKFHDGNKVEVFCYSLSPSDGSPPWDKISADHFKDISELKVLDAANLIKIDGIHILINMNGYTRHARNEIFALRPAPIQMLWFGYPNTSGAPFIDYLITDKVCSPPELGHFYTEEMVYLNQSVFIGDHKLMYNDLSRRVYKNTLTEEKLSLNNGNIHTKDNHSNELVSNNSNNFMYCVKLLSDGNLKCFTRQMFNLPEDVTVYCNFSQLFKIEPSTFCMWAKILLNVPNSVLWLLQFPGSGEHNLKKFAATLNIDLSRIIFSSVEEKEDHMLRIQLADIFLDTPLYNAHSTCLDVLWAGTPVITLPGKTLASRVAASQLTTLGCTETIADNEEDYVKKAIQLGLDKTLLESLRSKIWSLKTTSKLFDCKSYTEELENSYQVVWHNFFSKNHLKE